MFCSYCGEELPENAYFCPKCGEKTRIGADAGLSTPWEEFKDSFSKMGQEIEKAFSMAAKETEKAFKAARESIRESRARKLRVCDHCEEKNPSDAKFCYKCGKQLA